MNNIKDNAGRIKVEPKELDLPKWIIILKEAYEEYLKENGKPKESKQRL